MIFHISNDIKVENASRELLDWCAKHLSVDNPEFAQKKKMGLYIGNTPAYLCLYSRRGNVLSMPYGCMKPLYRNFKDTARFETDFAFEASCDYQSGIALYPYQQAAMESAYHAKHGIIVMPCGAGKTQTGLALAAKIGGRCLWVTHTRDLLSQSLNRAKACFNVLDPVFFGTVTEGKIDLGNGITFATVQTLASADLQPLKDYFSTIIVDECHHCVGTPSKAMMFYRVLSAFSAHHKYGLTATPERADGLEKCMYALIGGVCAKVGREAVASRTCPVIVKTVRTEWKPARKEVSQADGRLDYAKFIAAMCSSADRNAWIAGAIGGKTPMLALAERIDCLDGMASAYTGRSAVISGKTPKKKREEVLSQLASGGIDCVFATWQLAREGLDIPQLKYVAFCTPKKDPATVEQAAGRVGRKCEGKEKGTVIDFVDNFGYCLGAAKARTKIYRRLNYAID